MNTTFIIVGLAFVFILLTGFLLSRKGKPYNVILSSIHKLISLAVLVYIIVIVVQTNRLTPISSLEIAASVVTVLLFVALIATGGILSAAKTIPRTIQIIHRILPYLAILSTAATLYLFLIP
jgi:FtsH-binding integral membrane protein